MWLGEALLYTTKEPIRGGGVKEKWGGGGGGGGGKLSSVGLEKHRADAWLLYIGIKSIKTNVIKRLFDCIVDCGQQTW